MTYAEHLGRRLGEHRAEAALGLLGLLGALALGLLPLPVAAALLGALVVVTFAFFDPLWGLYALVLSVPIQELVLLPNGQTITQVCALLALLGLLLRTLQRRERRLPREMLLPWLFFLLSLLLGAAFASYSEGEATKMLGRWGAAFLAFELTLAAVTTRARAWGLIGCLLLAPLATALLGLWQFATATGPESFQVGRFVRAYGTLGKPNPLAGYLNMAWPLAATLAVALLARMARGWRDRWMGRGEHAGDDTTETRNSRRIDSKDPAPAAERATGAEARAGAGMPELRLLGLLLCAGVALTLVAGLGATYSRGGWLGAAAGAMLMVAFAGRKAALLDAALVGALALVLLGGGSLLPASVSGRLSSITANLRIFDAARANVDDDNFAVVERMAHWQAGARMFAANPVLGVGPGNFNLAYRDYFVGRWYQSQGHAHNYYIHIAAEAGLPGLLAYLLLILSASRAALRAVRVSAGTIWRAVAIGGCGIIAAVAAHQVFENLHVLNLGVQLSAVWGLMVVIVRLAQEKDRQPYAQALCH